MPLTEGIRLAAEKLGKQPGADRQKNGEVLDRAGKWPVLQCIVLDAPSIGKGC